MSLNIRRAITADAVNFEIFMGNMFAENLSTLVPRGHTPTIDQASAYLARHAAGDSAVFIAEISNTIVGSIALTGFARPQLNHAVCVGLNVASSFRGQGIGRSLLSHALQWAAHSTNIERVELEVIENNSTAIHLYEQHGFEREGIKRKAVKKPSGYFDMHIYGLLLKNFKDL